MWGIIATWDMATTGIKLAADLLKDNLTAIDAAETCVKDVEVNPEFTSVGYGGLPNELGVVEVDGAVMDGDTLSIGAIASIQDFLHPASIARTLLGQSFNNFLVGKGAENYALSQGFERFSLITKKSHDKWYAHQLAVSNGLIPYAGHDTVCAIALDQKGSMGTVVSTSGLFYKKAGRVGDSPIPGSGYYVDSEIGGAAATGLGEDIMKGVISYEIVQSMGRGLSPQAACEKAVLELHNKLEKKRGKVGDISVIALNANGEYGVATNIDLFTFVLATEALGFIKGSASYTNNKLEIKIDSREIL